MQFVVNKFCPLGLSVNTNLAAWFITIIHGELLVLMYDSMNDPMNSCFCGLHFVVGLADSAEATLNLQLVKQLGASGTSGTQRLHAKHEDQSKLAVQCSFIPTFEVKM